MPLTGETPYPRHCGCDDVVIMRELRDGRWVDTGIRKLTKTDPEPEEDEDLFEV